MDAIDRREKRQREIDEYNRAWEIEADRMFHEHLERHGIVVVGHWANGAPQYRDTTTWRLVDPWGGFWQLGPFPTPPYNPPKLRAVRVKLNEREKADIALVEHHPWRRYRSELIQRGTHAGQDVYAITNEERDPLSY